MDSSFRVVLVGAASIAIALVMLLPSAALLVVAVWLMAQAILFRVSLHRVAEPHRPIILRLGQMHRLGPSGVFFLAPWVDTIEGTVSMKPESQEFTVTQLHAGDGDGVYMNLELIWRLRPDIFKIDEPLKQMLLKTEEQRRRLVEQSVSTLARQLLLHYGGDQLKRADTRDHVTEILRTAVNEYLLPHGMMIDSIFWRGTNPAKEMNEAKLRIKIAHEQVQGMVYDMELVRQRFPDLPAEEFLAYQAWLELIRRGVSPPGVPNMPLFPLAPPVPKKGE